MGQAKHMLRRMNATPKGPYSRLRALLRQNPNLSASGRVTRNSHHYVHSETVSLELSVEGYIDKGDEEVDVNDEYGQLIEEVQEKMESWVKKMCGKIESSLQSDLDDQQTNEAIIESLDANEYYFDEEGEEVDMAHFVPADQLPAHIQLKVVQQHTDLFNNTPQQVIQDLVARKLRFNPLGEIVDVTRFKKASDLEPDIQEKVCDERRDWNTQDDYWAEGTIEYYTDEIERFGFDGVEINYSLGGSQGDGASFTATSIDVEQFLDTRLAKAKVESQATVLVRELLV